MDWNFVTVRQLLMTATFLLERMGVVKNATEKN